MLALTLQVVQAGSQDAGREPIADRPSATLGYKEQWLIWKESNNKTYESTIEELERFIIWLANKAYIDYHNTYSSKFGFTLKMNQFGDMVRRT